VAQRILLIDNYDSFTYNLVQYLGELGAEPIVFRNDQIDLDGIVELDPDGILISPGPGTPSDSGISTSILTELAGRYPIMGVCLGHQCIGEVFGGTVRRADAVMHGKTSSITHNADGLFAGLASPLEATRYHSLIVDRGSLPEVLEITAETDDGVIMGLRHREHPIYGVQFHPESILTAGGHDMIRNFLRLCEETALQTTAARPE
jgi:anthranilate synthase/aminodeoxychorismate synthase-like glutamine amidotransferase